jgi:EAL domain-containing protein (putative c-di-GMP-specific phosphodiesterase class I)/GGDEF domain-containing protein
VALKELSSGKTMGAHGLPPNRDDKAAADREAEGCEDVAYHWNLATDTIAWGDNLATVIPFATQARFATGLWYAEHLASESDSSRYEAIIAGGFDAGDGVAFQVVYGLSANPRSGAAPIWVEDTGSWFADANGRPGHAKGMIRVVTARHEAERLRVMAEQRDPVTGAFNKDHFDEHVARYLTLSTRKHTTFAVILADVEIGIDRRAATDLREIDAAMAQAAARIRRRMRGSEALARYDDTRFAMLLENCNGEQMAVAAARLIAAAEDIADRDGPERQWSARQGSDEAGEDTPADTTRITARAGGVIAPLYGRTSQALIVCATEALAMARETAGEPFVRYEPEAARNAGKRRLLRATDAIIAALNEGRVVLALQPVADARTRAVVFYEALLRIRDLDGTLIMPDVLVPAAEQGGLVALLDRRVVDLAFMRLAGDRALALSVNASVMSLHDPEWQRHFRAACALNPTAAQRLIVEITETCAIADIEATRAVLAMLKGLGIRIAIDDFGSGHSSFRAMRDLPIDFIKIDGAFARNFARSPDDRFFVRALIDLAKNLKIPTIAEWVEDEATALALTEWGIDLLQGHLIGKAEVSVAHGRSVAATG